MKPLLLFLGLMVIISCVSAVSDDSYTTSLLHFDGDYIDEYNSLGWTPHGNVTINTTTPKFGTGAGNFTGNGPAGVSLIFLATGAGSGREESFTLNQSFTIDFWYRKLGTTTGGGGLVFSSNSSSYFGDVGIWDIDTGLQARFSINGTGNFATMNMGTVTTNTWIHYAVVRNENVYTTYKNGVIVTNTSYSQIYPAHNEPWAIIGGTQAGTDFLTNSQIDEFRFSKVARWSSNFTPQNTSYITTWGYNTPGTYYWVCPANVTSVVVQVGGGGGSGRGGYGATGPSTKYPGGGGSSGDVQIISGITVTPGNNYTILVGSGGATGLYGEDGHDGTASSAFGITKSGGIAGELKTLGTSGGNGGNGFVSTTKYAVDGTNNGGNENGIAGLGYSAGGGGSGAGAYWGPTGEGGAGADGYVGITIQGLFLGNIPDFSGTPRTGNAGSVVHFTDLSTISNTTALVYLWDFGDGLTSTTMGDVVHVYSYTGSFDVSLTLTDASGSSKTTKAAYIIMTAAEQEISLPTQPVTVTFHVQSIWGTAIPNVNISIMPITTSTGDWDWIPLLLGIPLDEVPLNSTNLYQTTDSFGDASFLMIPTAKYNITPVLTGFTFTPLFITPNLNKYIIFAEANTTDYVGLPQGESNISITTSTIRLNDTHGRVNFSFIDSEASVTGGTIKLYGDNSTAGGARVLINTFPIPNSNFTNSTIVNLTSTGTSFILHTNATSSLETGYILKDNGVLFRGIVVTLGWLSQEIAFLLALFLIVITGMFAGRVSGAGMAIVVCAESWVFYILGWMDLMVNVVGVWVVVGCFILATVLSFIWAIGEGWEAQT